MDIPADWNPTWFRSAAAFVLEEKILHDPDKKRLRAQIVQFSALCAEVEYLRPSNALKDLLYLSLLVRMNDISDSHAEHYYHSYLDNVLMAMVRKAVHIS